MFRSIRTWSTTFKLQHYLWELGLVFLLWGGGAAPSPQSPPPASLFTTRSDTFKARQLQQYPWEQGLCSPPSPLFAKKSLCTCRTLFDMCRNICLYSFTDTYATPWCLDLHSTRSQVACSAVYTHGVPHSSYSAIDKPLKTWKLNQTMENRWMP